VKYKKRKDSPFKLSFLFLYRILKMKNDYLIYKVSFGQQVVSAAHALIVPALIIFFTVGLGLKMIICCLFVIVMLFWIPVFSIHFNYFKEDNGKIVEINYEDRIIIIQQYGQKKKIQFEDIQHITINHTKRYSPWLNYRYATFRLKNDRYVVITRFIMNFDEELYTLIDTKSKNHWYPIIEEEEGEKLI